MKNSRNPPSLFVNVMVVKITDNNTFITYLGIIYKIMRCPLRSNVVDSISATELTFAQRNTDLIYYRANMLCKIIST